MLEGFDKCPNCGQKVHKGAMRCQHCSKTLMSPEEQAQTIQRLKERKKGFNWGGLVKFIIFIAAAAAGYHFFSDQITALIRSVLDR